MTGFDLKTTIQILQKTPEVIEHLLSGLPADILSSNEGRNSWNVLEVVAHLVHGERTDWMNRTEQILSDRPDKLFESFDRSGHSKQMRDKSLDALLEELRTLRRENMERIYALQLDQKSLRKEGIHPDFGKVSLDQLLAAWAVHDLNHISQITRIIAHQYHQQVGPWVHYLRILNQK